MAGVVELSRCGLVVVISIGGVVMWCELGAGRPELYYTFLGTTSIVSSHQLIDKDVRDDDAVDDLSWHGSARCRRRA